MRATAPTPHHGPLGTPDATFNNLAATLGGSFTVSLWINTTNIVGNDDDDPDNFTGASVIWLFNDHTQVDGVLPLALTGNKAAFYTGDSSGNGNTLHSTNNVATGNYVHIVVTRNQFTGEKKLYVNGVLDSSDFGSTDILNGNNYFFSIGGVASAPYTGLLDDVQFYSGVLDSVEVSYLFNNPGLPAPNLTRGGLLAHFAFDLTNNVGLDSSGNGYSMNFGGGFNGGGNAPTNIAKKPGANPVCFCFPPTAQAVADIWAGNRCLPTSFPRSREVFPFPSGCRPPRATFPPLAITRRASSRRTIRESETI